MSLSPILDELTGINAIKPFECVGTPEEVNVALKMTFDKFQDKERVPALLKKNNSNLFENISKTDISVLMNAFNQEHFVPEKFLQFLTEALHD